jgi:hypothetical protein
MSKRRHDRTLAYVAQADADPAQFLLPGFGVVLSLPTGSAHAVDLNPAPVRGG